MKIKIIRWSAQIFIVIAILGLYSTLLLEENIELDNYIFVSSFISFCIIFSIIIELKSSFFPFKSMFLPFSFSHFKLISIRISMIFKKSFLIMVLFIPPIILFFLKELTALEKGYYYVCSSLQNLFTVYLFITIYDFFSIKGYEKHIFNLPVIIIIALTYLKYNEMSKFYIYNPFGGIINSPLYFSNPLFYPLPLLLFLIIYLFNKQFIHKIWIKNN